MYTTLHILTSHCLVEIRNMEMRDRNTKSTDFTPHTLSCQNIELILFYQ